MDRQNLLNAGDLAPIVLCHPRVQLIATGHVHPAALMMFAGVPTTICPAPNHAVDLDLAELREPSFKVEPPASTSIAGFRARIRHSRDPPSPHRYLRRAASVFWTGRQAPLVIARHSLPG
jgi:hypothetical protein